MEHRQKAVTILALLFIGVTAFAVFGANEPVAPNTFDVEWQSTFNQSNYALRTHDAFAGNITALSLTAVFQTKAWQGYYGNITATITLDDANNNTFYNWTAAEPRGQVYATLNDSVAWTTVRCFDYANTTGEWWSSIETFYNIDVDHVDGVNETFNQTNHPNFEVGSRTMTGCPTSYVFRDNTAQETDYVNVLLYDPNRDRGWIYTTLVENKTIGSSQDDKTCYNGEICDFQILVNEDGHGTDTDTTTYYFWVELA